MDLEFSENTKLSGQELLFGKSTIIVQKNRFPVSQSFYDEGYLLVDSVADVTSAELFLSQFISGLDERKIPLYSNFINNMQLAKIDLIPVCHDIIPRTFQALHFDMGQPIISPTNQTMYVILALYKPMDSLPSSAKTRVVSLRRLLAQVRFDRTITEQRLIDYVQQYGDGWKEPTTVNTLRLACFARIIDAITGRNELVDKIDNTTGQWFSGLEREHSFFHRCGIYLELAEQQITVKPGQLLIIDNMRCVHGRIGPRNPQEIYQFLFGVKSATPKTIDIFRQYLVELFAQT